MPGTVQKESPFAKQMMMLLDNQDTRALSPAQLNALRSSNAIFLAYYQTELERINPATFAFFNDEKKAQLRLQLQHTLCILTIQQRINHMDARHYHEQEINGAITLCQDYQLQLEGLPPIDNGVQPEARPVINAAASPIKYLGLQLIRWLAHQVGYVPNGNTANIINTLNDANKWRLYWVWGGGLLMSVLQEIPQDFFNNSQQAQPDLKGPANVLGHISWALYYFRFGVNLFLFAKHSLPCSWLKENDEEKQIPAWDRIKAQTKQRKFTLLNDIAWGSVNLVCFLWLVGSDPLIYAGNVLVIGLLVFDILLSGWRFHEEKKKFEHARDILNNTIRDLDDSINELDAWLQDKVRRIQAGDQFSAAELEEKKAKMEQLAAAQRQRQELEEFLKTTKSAWKLKRDSIINDISYSCGLLVGWCFIGGVFFPPATAIAAQSTIMALGLAGGVFCFALTVAYQALICHIEVAKIRSKVKENTEKIEALQTESAKLQPNLNQLQNALNALNAQDKYELCVNRPGEPAEANKLYVEFRGESILYTVNDPQTEQVVSGIINSRQIDLSLTTPLTIKALQPHLLRLLENIPAIPKEKVQQEAKRAQLKTQLEPLEKQSKYQFLEIKSLEAKNRYQQRMIRHQKLNMLRGIVIDAILPAVLFATLVFLPTGIGIGILAAALALVVLSKMVLKAYEPKPEPVPTFNETDYERTKVENRAKQQNRTLAADRNRLFYHELQDHEDRVDPYATSSTFPPLDLVPV